MKINNEFTVSAPIQQAWDTMLNLERIAPCLPGAAIQEEKDEGEYDGTMKVKIGPITANYKGTVKFEEVDEDNPRLAGWPRRLASPRRPPGHRPGRARPGYCLGDHRLDLAGGRRWHQGQRGDGHEAHRTRGPVRTGHRPRRGDEDARPVRLLPGRGDHRRPRRRSRSSRNGKTDRRGEWLARRLAAGRGSSSSPGGRSRST